MAKYIKQADAEQMDQPPAGPEKINAALLPWSLHISCYMKLRMGTVFVKWPPACALPLESQAAIDSVTMLY